MSNDLKCLHINFYFLLALNDDSFCKIKLNGIFRVALKAISWASGVELNYTLRRGNVFYYVHRGFFKKICVTFFTFFTGGGSRRPGRVTIVLSDTRRSQTTPARPAAMLRDPARQRSARDAGRQRDGVITSADLPTTGRNRPLSSRRRDAADRVTAPRPRSTRDDANLSTGWLLARP